MPGNRGPVAEDDAVGRPFWHQVRVLDDALISALFWAAIESTEEAIINALVAAETMSGQGGHIAHRLPHDRLVEVWGRYRRLGSTLLRDDRRTPRPTW